MKGALSMSKFRKILLAILILALSITALTVIAFATEETELKPVSIPSTTFEDPTFTTYAGYDIEDKVGKYVVITSDNGNKYLRSEYAESSTDSTTVDNLYVYLQKFKDNGYNFNDYPYLSVDFDIMTENGTYGSYASGAPALYNHNGSKGVQLKIMSGDKFCDIGLSTTPFEWQHLTIILEYTGNDVFMRHYYINGVYSTSTTNDYSEEAKFIELNGDYSSVYVDFFRLYPSNKPTANAHIGFDNFEFTYFPADYCEGESDLTKIATYHYDSEYKMPYKYTVATVNDGNGNVDYFDDINKAIAAAGKNDVIKLFEDVNEAVIVDKNITVDRNRYDSAGNKTGTLYVFEYTSSKAFTDTETSESGIFSFRKNANAVDIIWDEACAEDCDCYAEFGGHKMTATTIVEIGNVPEYFGTIPTFTATNGLVKKFEGWSYTKGGEVAELSAITEADAANGSLKLYPVYSSIQYDFEYTDGDKNKTFFFKKDFEDVFMTAVSTNNSSIVLYSDIEYYSTINIVSNVNFTLDLNGHTLTRINLIGNSFTYDEANASYVQGEALVGDKYAFKTENNSGFTFTLTSSVKNGVFKTASIDGNVYFDKDGKVQSYTADSVGCANFIYAKQPKTSTINIYNADIYAMNIIYNSWSGTKDFNLNMDNCKYYKTFGPNDKDSGDTGEGFIYLDSSYNINVSLTNSLFYFPPRQSNTFSFVHFTNNGEDVSVVFDNCDIISYNPDTKTNIQKEAHSITFVNSRVYNIVINKGSLNPTFGNDSIFNKTIASNANVLDGCVQVDATNTVNYNLPKNTTLSLDANGKPSFNFEIENRDITFTSEIKLISEIIATVNWLDENGKLIKTESVLKNSTATAPEYAVNSGDGYRGIKVTKWLDESGNVSNLAILDADTYTFKASPVVDENTEYVARITEAQFNFIFYGSFTTVLYLPRLDGMEMPTVADFTPGDSTVKIGGMEYWSFYKDNTTTNVSEDLNAVVNFTIDGKAFSETLTLNALIYAKAILSSPENDIESRAIANMVRYIKEARLAAGLEISNEFAAVEALYSIDAYKESYSDLGADTSALNGYVDSIRFMLHGSYASYVITLSENAVNNGAALKLEFADSKKTIFIEESDLFANSYYTAQTRVYDLTRLIRISVTVNENGTQKTVSGTYSIGAYINSEKINLAKAIYEFGTAASTYREYLTAKYSPDSSDVILYTATFMADGITVGTEKFNICTEAINEPAVPEKNGYTGAWEKYYITNNNIVINAVYTPINYTITYNLNNAYATHSNKESYTIETETFNISAPVSEGDTFLGWYLDALFTTPAPDFIEKGSYGNITLYGNWDCIHKITVTERKDATPLKDGYEITNCEKCFSQERTETLPATKSIKLLAIGNSFSIDALEYFGAILSDAGVEDITIANLYDAGCSINEHLSFIEEGTPKYTLYLYNPETKNMVSQGSTADKLVSLEYALNLDDWEIITMQQASGSSYKPSTYDRLDELVDYVRGYNTTAKLYWHMTWAYDTWYLSEGRTSLDMYTEIVDAVAQKILTRDDFSMIIPAGTAVENMRTSYVGDDMTRDGYHLNKGYGRYTAALTWFAYICGVSVEDVNYVPSSYPEIADMLTVIKEAVRNAVTTPFAVTDSLYPPTTEPDEEPEEPETPVEPENPEFPTVSTAETEDLTAEDIAYIESIAGYDFDTSKYKRLVLNIQDDAFYNSKSSSNKDTTNQYITQFACTDIFDRSELVVRSIIRFSSEYAKNYRPEGWTELNEKTADRPDTVTAAEVVVDEAWWGDFNYRAFNIQKTNITLEEAQNALIIYVPISN